MISKHTPGPWIVNDARDGQSVLFQIESSVQANKPEVIVAMLDDGNASVSEQRANARLIASAPEMLAALKFFATLSHPAAREHFDTELIGRMLGQARTAIAKAEGLILGHLSDNNWSR